LKATQRCRECDGIQPRDAHECEVCGALLDDFSLLARPEPPGRVPATKGGPTRPGVSLARTGRVPLAKALLRESRFVVGWTIVLLVVLMATSMPLTFAPPNASPDVAIRASLHYVWLPLLLSAVIAWLGGLCFDIVQTLGRKPAWSASLAYYDVLLGVTIPALFVFSSSRSGAIPPSTWSYVPLVSTAGFLMTLALRLLVRGARNPGTARLPALVCCLSALAIAWLLAPLDDTPSQASQFALDHRLKHRAGMANCHPVPLSALPAGLFRNSLTGMVKCHQGGLRGSFLAFHNRRLLDVYASQRENVRERKRGRSARRCRSRSGTFTGSWHHPPNRSYTLGSYACFGRGRHGVIEWQDLPSNLFATVRGGTRPRLYRWWRRQGRSL
jgi:hypothetical protein